MRSFTRHPVRIHPVGHVSGGRSEAIDDDWGASRACIVIDPGRFTPDALLGLDQFSHAEVIFLFDQVDEADITAGARHPRGRSDWPRVGIFAQRGKNRPNRLGIGVCRIIAVSGMTVTVEGLDAIDGTPVIDIKPVMRGFSPRGPVHEPDWASAIMADYW